MADEKSPTRISHHLIAAGRSEMRNNMKFRPCIDIHNGKVKQVVGSSIKDEGNIAKENFVSEKGADYYANLYKARYLSGGHIILLNHKDSEYYEASGFIYEISVVGYIENSPIITVNRVF